MLSSSVSQNRRPESRSVVFDKKDRGACSLSLVKIGFDRRLQRNTARASLVYQFMFYRVTGQPALTLKNAIYLEFRVIIIRYNAKLLLAYFKIKFIGYLIRLAYIKTALYGLGDQKQFDNIKKIRESSFLNDVCISSGTF